MRRTSLALIAVDLSFASLGRVAAETLPLPANLIRLDSTEGEALLIGAEARDDFFPLIVGR